MRLRDIMPKGYWARTALITFFPIVVMMVGMTWYFFNDHMRGVNERLADAVARDAAMMAATHDRDPAITRAQLGLIADAQSHELAVRAACPLPGEGTAFSRRLPSVRSALQRNLDRPYTVAFTGPRDDILLCVPSNGDVLVFTIPRKSAMIINGHIYIVWVLLFGLLLLATAFAFLRNQVRSILHLTEAAKAFGRGQDVEDFRPSGATEVRDAARAVMNMRRRLTAFADQRTAMLAGVSHDLRTPLTRLKLQLAMMDETDDIIAARSDVSQMGAMLDEYLAFASGEETEQAETLRIDDLVRQICDRSSGRITISDLPATEVKVRRIAIGRAIGNLIANAAGYGESVEITLLDGPHGIDLLIDDDGPGIPPEDREDAFRPFKRLDEARSQNVPGTGLGLALARDTARAHGGDVRLETSPLGGLRARLRLPH